MPRDESELNLVTIEFKPDIGYVAHVSILVLRPSQRPAIVFRKIEIEPGVYQFELPSVDHDNKEDGFVISAQHAIHLGATNVTSDIMLLGRFQKVAPHNGGIRHGIREFYGLRADLRQDVRIGKPGSPYVLFSEEQVMGLDDDVFTRPADKRAALAHFAFEKTGHRDYTPFEEPTWDDSDPIKAKLYKAYLSQYSKRMHKAAK